MPCDSHLTQNAKQSSPPLVATLLALIGGVFVLGTKAASQSPGESYTWSAEIVSVDAAAGTAVVKSRVVHQADPGVLEDLEAGDRVTITWSGITHAAGIRSISEGAETATDGLTLPAEFVSTEMDGQYVAFRVPVPSESVAEIASLMPGEWATFTSPHRPGDWSEAVVDARPYNDVG